MIRQERFDVSFPVSLMYQERSGLTRRVAAKCLDFSGDGMKIEARDKLDNGTAVVVQSDEFGRLGHATVRFSKREGLKCVMGLRFAGVLGLSDAARRKIMSRVAPAVQ